MSTNVPKSSSSRLEKQLLSSHQPSACDMEAMRNCVNAFYRAEQAELRRWHKLGYELGYQMALDVGRKVIAEIEKGGKA